MNWKEYEHQKFVMRETLREIYNLEEKNSRKPEEKVKDMFETFVCQQCHIEFPISVNEHGWDNSFLCIEGISPICPNCLEINGEEYEKWKKARQL